MPLHGLIGQCPLRDLASPVKRPVSRSVEDARSRFMSPGRSIAPCCGRDADRYCAKLQRLACDDWQIAGDDPAPFRGRRGRLWSTGRTEHLHEDERSPDCGTLLIVVGRFHLCRPRQAVTKLPVTKSGGRPPIGEKAMTVAERMRKLRATRRARSTGRIEHLHAYLTAAGAPHFPSPVAGFSVPLFSSRPRRPGLTLDVLCHNRLYYPVDSPLFR